MTIGAELTRLGANCFGAEVQGHFLHVVDVVACVARTWHEFGTVNLDAKIGVVDLDTELGVNYYGAELWKLINFNFYHDSDIEKCG